MVARNSDRRIAAKPAPIRHLWLHLCAWGVLTFGQGLMAAHAQDVAPAAVAAATAEEARLEDLGLASRPAVLARHALGRSSGIGRGGRVECRENRVRRHQRWPRELAREGERT